MEKKDHTWYNCFWTLIQCEIPLQEPANVAAVEEGLEHEGTNTSHILPLYICLVYVADILAL